jgi:hypothetical protein
VVAAFVYFCLRCGVMFEVRWSCAAARYLAISVLGALVLGSTSQHASNTHSSHDDNR